ncbi:MAG TPA: enoyl-CoA hydratase/isomerase family protein [Candidatus Binataceae bacterium]|nr:enoyl-CoA hydratase/isomerase family protein [Candidatus Binataceae bacterium]
MEYFKVEQHGHIQVWTINNPPMNYMTGPLSRELVQLIGKLEGDDQTRVLIITGGVEGKFITHYSVDELAASAADPAECARVMPRFFAASHRTLNRVMLLPQAVIAAINGDCMGGGYELALACDFRLAADGPFQIGLIEILLGLLPGGGGTQRLTRLIGRGPALEALLFGTAYSPAEAHRIGMVNRVVPPEKLLSTAMEWAEVLAKRPPRSIAAIKRAVYLGGDRDLETGLYVERNEMASVIVSEDARTLMGAYNAAVAKDPMAARSEFLKGVGIPPTKGR